MAAQKEATETADFGVENIGGIDATGVSIPPGVTVLAGKNATNRTSLLQSITAALGSRRATLKGDADEGRVEMELGGETYRRTLKRVGDGVKFEGDGYLDSSAVADLFAFLFEDNEARQSVVQGDNLRELIMRPVDTEEIRQRIAQLEDEKDEIDDKIADIERDRDRLSELEVRKSEIQSSIDEKKSELAEKEQEIETESRDVDESRDEKEALESKLSELRDVRSELESVRNKIEKQEESVASLKQERTEQRDELDEMDEAPMGAYEELETQIQDLRAQRKQLSSKASELQSLIQYNEEQLESGGAEALQPGDGSREDGAVTSQLLEAESDDVVCWTCGSAVQRSQIEETVERLKELRSQRMDELNDVKNQLESLKSEQREKERLQRRREEIEGQLSDIESEIERRETQISSFSDRRAELTDEVEQLETEVEELESEDFESVLALHREANQLEFEIDRLESDKADITEEIESIEQSVDELEELRAERARIADDLTDQRTKIDQFEAEALESFNDHMSAILDILEYENIDRIWIERLEQTVREGRRKVETTRFELHIVRTTDNGTAYEDTIGHLSESEREVTGLIFALAGYLVHDVHETVPFMLIDSLEAIDAERIALLVEYLSEYAEYLVVALLSEDAAALSDSYNRVTEI